MIIQPERIVANRQKEYQDIVLTSKTQLQEGLQRVRFTDDSQKMLIGPKTGVTVTTLNTPIIGLDLDSYDKAVKGNPQYVTDYIKDIEKHLKANEVNIALTLAH
jgi:hypothetical protein